MEEDKIITHKYSLHKIKVIYQKPQLIIKNKLIHRNHPYHNNKIINNHHHNNKVVNYYINNNNSNINCQKFYVKLCLMINENLLENNNSMFKKMMQNS